jgi:DNA-binding NarL/FixJ family response regulator
MIHILIADDHHLIRKGIRALLEKQPDFQVIAEAENGEEAFNYALTYKPDVLILDINMPKMSGLEVTQQISDSHLPVEIIILSLYSDESLIKRALIYGVKGYVLKTSVVDDLITAVRSVSNHKTYLRQELRQMVNWDAWMWENEDQDWDSENKKLSTREREVCQYIARSFTNLAIAQTLGISVKTVEKHRANLMAKLGVQDVASLIQVAIRNGIVILDK